MRLLHTSDWHLGRTLHGVNLHAAQASVLGRLCELVESPPDGVPVDAVLISGDVYDRGVPPVESVQLFEQVLARLSRHTTVVVTSGNHDSAIRLGYGSALFTDRIRVMTDAAVLAPPVRLTGSDGVRALVYGVPWIDPDHGRYALAEDPAQPLPRSHQAVLSAALDRVRADLAEQRAADAAERGASRAAERVASQAADLGASEAAELRGIVMAHAFIAGADPSESERSIMVGGVDRVAASTFDGLDYAALGHLHGPQAPAGSTALVRYSGSPLRYSFSEQEHTKVVLMVDVPALGPVTATAVPIEQPRAMASVRGRLEELLEDPSLEGLTEAWLRVHVTDRVRPDALMDRLRSRFPHVLQVFHDPEGALQRTATGTTVGSERDPSRLGADFVAHVTKTEASQAEVDVFVAGYEAALTAERASEVA